METRLESALLIPTPVIDIMEAFTLQIVEQFFMMMKYCIKLVLSERSPFEFVRSLLENQVKNIKQTGDSDRAKVYQVLVEQLGTYSKDLKSLENANLVADTQWVSDNLRATQERG